MRCSSIKGCAASGHAAAAPPSAAINSRRPMMTVMRPSRARVRTCNDTTRRARCRNCVALGAGRHAGRQPYGSPPGFRRALINRDCPASTLPPRADRKRSVAGQCNGCNGSRSAAMAAVNSRAGAGCDPGRPANFFRQQHLGTLTRLPVPAQHGGQSNRGERDPNEPANQMLARLRRGLGALRLAFVGVSHVRCSNSRLRHCKLGRKKPRGCFDHQDGDAAEEAKT